MNFDPKHNSYSANLKASNKKLQSILFAIKLDANTPEYIREYIQTELKKI